MSKPAIRRLLYPMLILLAALLFAGCAAAERPAAGTDGGTAAATAAAPSAQPAASVSPQAGDTAATAPPSAPAGSASPSPAAETAPPEGAASAAAPTAPPDSHRPAPGAGPAEASAQPAPGPSAGAAQPAGTARPASAPPQAASSSAQPAAEAGTAVISITGDEEHGVILAPAAYEIKAGESALELLKRITRQHKIQMESQGAKSFAYVEGIDNLYEFDHGAGSGWMYKVNGAFLDKGAGSYTVNPGDTIEWLYTLDLGRDLGAGTP